MVWSHAASQARRTRTAIGAAHMPSSVSPGRADGHGAPDETTRPTTGPCGKDLGRSSPLVARRREGARATRTGEGRWTARASTNSYDSTFRLCGSVRQGGKGRQAQGSCYLCCCTLPVDSPLGHPDLPPLGQAVDEAGLCLVHSRCSAGSLCSALSQRLAARRGRHRAMLAVAHARMRQACSIAPARHLPAHAEPTRVTSRRTES